MRKMESLELMSLAERHVEIAPDGSTFGDKVILLYEGEGDERITFSLDPDGLFDVVHAAIARMAQGGVTNDNQERKRLASLMKVAIKGMLLMYGTRILDELFLTKDHPKPGKGDDLLDWYTDIFTKVAIGYLMKSDTVLTGKTVQTDGNESIVEINEVTTRPIPAPSAVG